MQGQGWVLPGVDRGVHQGRLALEEKVYDLVHRFRRDELVVVEDQGQGAGRGGDVVDQGGHQALDGCRARRGKARRVKHRLDGAPDPPIDLLQSGDQIVEELDRIVVTLVERDPGYLARAGADPLGDQCGLAKAGRRGNEGQPVPPAEPVVQLLEEMRARHQVGSGQRDIELGGQERKVLGRHLFLSQLGWFYLTTARGRWQRGAGAVDPIGVLRYNPCSEDRKNHG